MHLCPEAGRCLAAPPVITESARATRANRALWRSARTLQSALFPRAGGAPEIAIRLDGVPSEVTNRTDDVLLAALAKVPAPRMTEGVRDTLSGGAELGSIS